VRVGIIGAGWSGATCAWALARADADVEVFESAPTVGGHSRVETLNGVVYEPNGAHIFHTSDAEVAALVQQLGMTRTYEHRVKTLVHLDDDEPVLLSWPPQISELKRLSLWPVVQRELEARPGEARGESFDEYVTSLMGPTLYRLFIADYTAKQWGVDPSELSSSFAPKRVDLRNDDDTRLFRDTWELFPPAGPNTAIERLVSDVTVHAGRLLTMRDLVEDTELRRFDRWVVTAPLDAFVEGSFGSDLDLEWRGIAMRSRYVPTRDPRGTVSPAYVVNYPDARYPYTRTVETKHASGQAILGTVLSEEHPGAKRRHYPIPTIGRTYERRNDELKKLIRAEVPADIQFCGRLANYLYINQDQAIRQGLDCAQQVLTQA
jgi:UDP-galactopyranose mutase